MTVAEQRPVLLSAAALAGAALLAYVNSFAVPFLFDDLPAIVANPSIRHLADALNPPASGATVSGRPLLNLSFALNYALGGTGVRGYHAVNLAIHLLAALTLFGVIRRTLLSPSLHPRFGDTALPLAFFAALLWTVHPLQTESVTYLAQRAESLAALFYLLALYTFIRSQQCHVIRDIPSDTRSRLWLSVSVAACALGLGCKETVATAPLIVLLYDRTFVAGSFLEAWRRRATFHLALAATWLVPIWLTFANTSRGGTAGFEAGVSWFDYALTQCSAVPHYLRLALWPQPLVFDYGIALANGFSAVALPLLALAALVAATLFFLRRRPALGFLGAWFFVILAPSSSLVPIVSQTIAEHRVYLPLAAIAVAAVLALHALLGRWTVLACTTLALGCIWATVQRNTDYRSALALWTDTAAKRPSNPRAHFNVGLLLAAQGDAIGAEKSFRAANALDPRNAEVHLNLGLLLAAQHRLPDAIAAFTDAVRLAPDSLVAHTSLGHLLLLDHRAAEAIPHYTAALRSDPSSAAAHYHLANALAQAGQSAGAVAHYEDALRLRPDYADAHHNLAALLASLGRTADAQPHLAAAARLDPSPAPTSARANPEVEARNNRGNALLKSGHTNEAITEFESALRLQPDSVPVRINLGNALAEAGRVPDAIKSYEEAIRLQPASVDAHFALGNIFAQSNRLAPAAAEYQTVLRLRPDDVDARNNLGNVFLLSGRGSDAIREYREALRLRPDDANARTGLEQALALPPATTANK